MFFHYLISNRRKITEKVFVIFLIAGFSNLAFTTNMVTFAEGDGAEVQSTETPTETSNLVTEESEPTPQEPAQDAEELVTSENTPPETELETKSEEEKLPENGDIESGDAVASTDVLNQVNTNEVDSQGEIVLVSGSFGDSSLDLREFDVATATPNQSSSTCSNCLASTTLENQNTATITNEILVKAETGGNTASSSGSNITTGDALSAANVVNAVNTNIVDSNYMLLVFNNLGDWSGDFVLPNGDFFNDFLSLFGSDCNCKKSEDISSDSNANVLNNVDVSSNSGENQAGADIDTGDALANSNVQNLVNTNIYKNSSFYLLIKVFGDWSGNIFNLPDNIALQNTKEGIVLYNKNQNPSLDENNFSDTDSILKISNNNFSEIENSVKVEANTGDNLTGESGLIQTGNAYAAANVVNVVNTNIISSNWMMALVNVLGDWSGNISFGQPDLWVGTVANIDGKAEAGSNVFFTTTVKNRGDARASDINVLTRLKTSHFSFMPEEKSFNIHKIESLLPGESAEISFYGHIDLYANGDEILIESHASSLETDANIKDNRDKLSFVATYNPGAINLPQKSFSNSYPDISLSKTHTMPNSIIIDGVEMVPQGEKVDFKIVVKNEGGDAYEGVLYDELVAENGRVLNSQSWELGKILANEEITVSYTMDFNEDVPAGAYVNYAWLEAKDGNSVKGLRKSADSQVVSDTVIVAPKPEFKAEIKEVEVVVEDNSGEILGVSTEMPNILRKPIDQTSQFHEFLTGICTEESNDEKANDLLANSKGMLLGLSLLLVMHRVKKVPTNLFLV
ncbi:MAG TPA: hypothetical protein VJB58_01810 [Candidatus Paceibacterota bacterium]